MAKFKISGSRIRAISTVAPPRELSLLDDATLYNGDAKRLQRVIRSSGFLKRRVADAHVMTSDLCEQAANDLFDNAGFARESIDALIFISYTPDYLMPATSYVLHSKLGLSRDCIVMDIPQACSGFVLGLFQSSMLLQTGCKRVLLMVGDSFSKFTDMFSGGTAPVFGDAGSATIIDRDEAAAPFYFNIQSDGAGYDSLMCENGGFRNPPKLEDFDTEERYVYKSAMDGARIFDFTSHEIAPSILELFAYSGHSPQEMDYYVLHQANKVILQNIAHQVGFDSSKMPVSTLTEYGNQCGASIPCTISDTLRDIVTQQETQILTAGFGVGLSWASAIIQLNNIYCSKLTNYKE